MPALNLLPAFRALTDATDAETKAYSALADADEHSDPTQIDVALVHINNAITRLQQARTAARAAVPGAEVCKALVLGRAIETLSGNPTWGPDSYSVRPVRVTNAGEIAA